MFLFASPCLSLFSVLSVLLLVVRAQADFDPYAYDRQSVICPATNRNTGLTEDISISFVEFNPDGLITLVFVHGWPGLWSTWFRQIEAFKKDYRIIALDLRGFGSSTSPTDIRYSGTFGDHVGDIDCVLKNLEISNAVCVGHDWGASICYEAGRARTDLFQGIVGVTIPYLPAVGHFIPAKALPKLSPALAYQEYFNSQTETAVRELNQNIRKTLRATLGSKGRRIPSEFLKQTHSFLGAWGAEDIPPIDFFTPRQEDYLVEAFERQGFGPTLGFYMDENRRAHWDRAASQGNHTIPFPVLTIIPDADLVGDWKKVMKMVGTDKYILNFRTEVVDGAHWIQADAHVAVNEILQDWLKDKFGFMQRHLEEERDKQKAMTWSGKGQPKTGEPVVVPTRSTEREPQDDGVKDEL